MRPSEFEDLSLGDLIARALGKLDQYHTDPETREFGQAALLRQILLGQAAAVAAGQLPPAHPPYIDPEAFYVEGDRDHEDARRPRRTFTESHPDLEAILAEIGARYRDDRDWRIFEPEALRMRRRAVEAARAMLPEEEYGRLWKAPFPELVDALLRITEEILRSPNPPAFYEVIHTKLKLMERSIPKRSWFHKLLRIYPSRMPASPEAVRVQPDLRDIYLKELQDVFPEYGLLLHLVDGGWESGH